MIFYRRVSTWISDEVSVSRERKLAWDAARRDTISATLVGVYVGVLGPYLGLVAAKTFHASVLLLSVMMMAPFLGAILTPLWVHHLHGRPKLPFVIIPASIARLLYVFTAFAHSATSFVLVVGAAQFLETSTGPAYCAVMERVYPRSMRGRIMSYVRVARSAVAVVVTLGAGRVLDQWGFRPVFVAAALFGLISIAVFASVRVPARLDRLERESTPAKAGATWQIFRTDAAYRKFGISIFLYGLGNLMLSPIYPLFLANTLHVTYAQQGILAFVGMLASVLGFIGWGSIVDRHGPIRCVYISIALVAVKPFAFYMAPGYLWLLPALFLDGMSNAGIEIGYLNSILSFSPPSQAPSYQALHSTLLGIRGILAPILAGALVTVLQAHHAGVRPAFLVSGVLILAGLWLGRTVRIPEERAALRR